ncbi:hypothetical protein COB72_01020 [bacterium]|nr:MAG: hypothetical protein COB72_01020 [bacterium]
MPHSEIELKVDANCTQPGIDQKIAEQVAIATGSDNLQSIAMKTGFNSETTRRYMLGDTKIPAEFIRQIAIRYRQDANVLLCLSKLEPISFQLQSVSIDVLINELGRRMKMIENCAVASVMVNPDKF